MDHDDEIQDLTRQIEELKGRLSEARRRRPPEPVADYALTGWDGETVTLASLFGDRDDLIVVHNMGKGWLYSAQPTALRGSAAWFVAV